MSKTSHLRDRIVRVSEPDLYAADSPHSWLRDRAALGPVPTVNVSFDEARDRLMRHAGYEARRRQARQRKRLAEFRGTGAQGDSGGATASMSGRIETRDLSLTAGQGLEFSPPIWMLDRFASIARAAAPLLKKVPSAPLPDDTSQVYIPRATVVSDVVPQAVENTNPPTFWQATDQITCEVATIAGTLPMSTQFWERSPGIEGFLAKDFAESFAAAAEAQILAGTGSDGQVLGWLNVSTSTVDSVPGANAVIYSSSTPSTAGVVEAIGQAAGLVGSSRLRPADCAVMTPNRYAWIAGYPDGSATVAAVRPGTGTVGGDTKPWGPVAGLAAYLDAAIPGDLGAGDEDAVIVVRAKDSLFLQSDPSFSVMIDTSGGPSQLVVVAQYHVYLAFFGNRYPSAIATVTGSGMSTGAMW